jgi:hypothetical protein
MDIFYCVSDSKSWDQMAVAWHNLLDPWEHTANIWREEQARGAPRAGFIFVQFWYVSDLWKWSFGLLLANNIPKGSSWLLETVPWYICIWSLLLFGCWICSSGAAGFLVDLPSWQFISSCPVLLKFLLVFYVLLFFPLIFKIFNLTWTMHILESSQRQQRLRMCLEITF